MENRNRSLSLLASLIAANLFTAVPCTARAQERTPVVELQFIPCESHGEQLSEGVHPELRILADGTVDVWSPDGRQFRSHLSPPQLETLLHDLVVDCRLGEVDSRRLKDDVQAAGVRVRLSTWAAGAEDTVIKINTPQQHVDVRCHATGLMAARFPEVPSLRSVMAAQERLQNLRALVLLGDDARAEMLAERASASLRSKFPGCSPLTPRDLTMVHTLPDGTRLVQFCQRPSTPAPADAPLVIVSMMDVPGEQPRVMVMSGDRVVR